MISRLSIRLKMKNFDDIVLKSVHACLMRLVQTISFGSKAPPRRSVSPSTVLSARRRGKSRVYFHAGIGLDGVEHKPRKRSR